MRAARRDWEPHEIETIKRMRAAGDTNAAIGAALGGRSEQAVRWKIREIGLPPRRMGRQPNYGINAGRAPAPRWREPARPPRKKVAVFLDHAEPIRFVDRKYDQCAFIEGDAVGEATMCCGRKVVIGSSWCDGHRTICTREERT